MSTMFATTKHAKDERKTAAEGMICHVTDCDSSHDR